MENYKPDPGSIVEMGNKDVIVISFNRILIWLTKVII